MATVAIRVVIEGRVQGVWYRGWTIDQARALGLDGWVRNRMDGTVEAVFSGQEDKVRAMIEACRTGPPAARVTRVHETSDHPPGERGFHQLPTK